MVRKLLYFTDELTSTVRESQVKENLDLLCDESLVLFVPMSLSTFLTRYREYLGQVELWRNTSKYKIVVYPILRRSEINVTTNLIVFLYVLLFVSKKSNLVLFTRTRSVWMGLLMFKLFFKSRLLIDNRGAWPEEFRESRLDTSASFLFELKYSIIRWFYAFCLGTADSSLVVSHGLKEYSESISSLKSYFVMPCTARAEEFMYNVERRRLIREELCIGESLTLVYSGSLKEYYQNASELFKFFSDCVRSVPTVRLLCITPDLDLAQSYSIQYGLTKNISCFSVNKNEIADYLSASDIGVVLRKHLVTNFVASPTKVAEMLISGLPLLISSSLKDYASYVNEFKCGVVIDDDKEFDFSLLETLRATNKTRLTRGSVASRKYSKESYLDRYRKFIYEGVVG